MLHEDLINQRMGYQANSDKYEVITTQDVMSQLNQYGFETSNISASKPRKRDKIGYQRHVVRMRNTDLWQETEDKMFPEIVITNSYDRTSSFNLHFGIYRLVCSNGLVVGNDLVAPFKIKHIGENVNNIPEYIDMFYDNSNKVYSAIDDMKNIQVTQDMRNDFMEMAFDIRDEDVDNIIRPERILQPTRYQDVGDDLWRLYNTVQEKVMKGDYKKRATMTRNGYTRDIVRKGKIMTDVNRQITANKLLFDKAMEYVS